jgi:O-antigen ligase
MLVIRPRLGLLALVPMLPFFHPRAFPPHGPMVILAAIAVGSVGTRVALGRLRVLSPVRPAVWLSLALLAATTFQMFLGVRTFGRAIPLAALSQYDQAFIVLAVLGVGLIVLPGRSVRSYYLACIGSVTLVGAIAVVHFVEPRWLDLVGLGWLVRPDTLNYRASGIIASPNFLGLAMAAAIAWTVVTAGWHVVQYGRDAARWVVFTVPATGLALLLTFSRAAIAAVVAGSIVALARWSPRTAMVLVAVALVGTVVLYPFFVDLRLGRTFGGSSPAGGELLSESDQLRTVMAGAAIEAFLDAPIAGHGFATFSTISPRYSGQSVLTSAHNEYLKLAAEQGVIGLVLFCALLVALVVPTWRAGPGPWTASLAVAGVFAVFSLTADSLSNAQAASGTFVLLAAGVAEAASRRTGDTSVDATGSSREAARDPDRGRPDPAMR